MERKQLLFNEKQRFSIRKLSVGAASVLLGTTLFFSAQTQKVQAATDDTKQNISATQVSPQNGGGLQ